MELVEGEPIKKKQERLMNVMAEVKGQGVKEMMAEMNEEMKDPVKLKEMMRRKGDSSEGEAALKLRIYRMLESVLNGLKSLANAMLGTKYTLTSVAKEMLNGPKIIELLLDIHAHQIFHDGLFNSDPHAGNVLMMPDGRLGLIDYGAAYARNKSGEPLAGWSLPSLVAKSSRSWMPVGRWASRARRATEPSYWPMP